MMKAALRIAGRIAASLAAWGLAVAIVNGFWISDQNNEWRSGDAYADRGRLARASRELARPYRNYLRDLRRRPSEAFQNVAAAARSAANDGRHIIIWIRPWSLVRPIGFIRTFTHGMACDETRRFDGLHELDNARVTNVSAELDSVAAVAFVEVWNRAQAAHPRFPLAQACGPSAGRRYGDRNERPAFLRPPALPRDVRTAYLAGDAAAMRRFAQTNPPPAVLAQRIWCDAITKNRLDLAIVVLPHRGEGDWPCHPDPLFHAVHSFEAVEDIERLFRIVPMTTGERTWPRRSWPALLYESSSRGRADFVAWVMRRADRRFTPDELTFALRRLAGRNAGNHGGATNGDEDAVRVARLLLQAGADAGARWRLSPSPDVRDLSNGMSLLGAAARSGDSDLVRLLLAHGADPNAISTAGWRPLQLAVQARRADVVAILLAAGASPNATASARDNNAFVRADRRAAMSPLRLALEPDAPFTWIFSAEQLAIVDLLLRAGADPNERGEGAEPPLAAAMRYGSLPLVRVLLEHGADPNAECCNPFETRYPVSTVPDAPFSVVDASYVFAGDWAQPSVSLTDGEEILAALIRAGGKPSVSQSTLDAALIEASYDHNAAWLKRLIDLGARATARDAEGGSALDHALEPLDLTPASLPSSLAIRRRAHLALAMEARAHDALDSTAMEDAYEQNFCAVISMLRRRGARAGAANWPKLWIAFAQCRKEGASGSLFRKYQAALDNPAVRSLDRARTASTRYH